ncbi:stealth conserved region 3 domain-containing protein [Catenovulum sp. SX2]|uniref:stealth conserved region 3 domain-containing protein n=1 Tax=Catenovulum sp. SX2 TaxID=3398614 RepID=UPI003F84AEE4
MALVRYLYNKISRKYRSGTFLFKLYSVKYLTKRSYPPSNFSAEGITIFMSGFFPVHRMSMMEKGEDILYLAILDKHIFDFLTLYDAILPESQISELNKVYKTLKKAGIHSFSFNGLTINVVLWQESRDYFQTKFVNNHMRRLYKSSHYGSLLFKKGKAIDLGSIIFTAPIQPINKLTIDAVYTWVNHEDSSWRELYNSELNKHSNVKSKLDSLGLDRFYNRHEIYYSIQSVKKYASWINHIYIVTNCRPLQWMLNDPHITIVCHSDIIERTSLPTFNSHAIESCLHKIEGLSNYFLYFNDDFFLVDYVKKSDFFTHSGLTKANFEEYGMVHGDADQCSPDYLNAARNGQKLIQEKFGFLPTKLHKHSPYALRVDILQQLWSDFYEQADATMRSKFRSSQDISIASFLFHYYSLSLGQTIETNIENRLISQKINYKRWLNADFRKSKVKTICLNDGGGGSASNSNWNKAVSEFLNKFKEI